VRQDERYYYQATELTRVETPEQLLHLLDVHFGIQLPADTRF